jgi:NADP-dependent 3-hydroxy acid dehydrogenase YdfG
MISPMKHLKNKTIWITGASAGIGEALAKEPI